MSAPQEPGKMGMVDRIVTIVTGLSFHNVAIIAILLMLAAPTYLAWRVINDAELQRLLFSSYEELPLPLSECSVRVASKRGGSSTWFISNSYAMIAADRWYLGVNIQREPTVEIARQYCDALSGLIAHMRDHNQPIPNYPGTSRQMFYPSVKITRPSEEGVKK